ncbi:MAG: 3'-5' exoribonuclease YhaM [Phycisphaerae bacterium]|nr:3'-5' exoribonuclease YhaM [Phycisphaerae bacterium]
MGNVAAGPTAERGARRSISSLQAGERVDDEIFLIAQKDLRTTNTGSLYIHAVLADKTGQLVARMWNASQEIFDSMPEGGFLHLRGRVENYKGNRQFVIDGVRGVEGERVDLSEFMPHTQRDVEQMWERAKEILRTIRNPDLLALVARFVNDPQFVAGFKKAPAAVQLHHAFVGGLLEHTLNLLELAALVIPRYPAVSLDLVLAGLLLHDCGKIRELMYESNFGYTNEGQLLGHIVQGVTWMHDKCGEIEAATGRPFPAEIETALKHIIVSHHGKYEFGSPRLPATLEAVAVHYLDNLDAKLNQYQREIEKDNDPASDWTNYVPTLETKVFKPDVMGIRGRAAGDPPVPG